MEGEKMENMSAKYEGEKNWKYGELAKASGREAKQYYLWFIQQIDKRIDYLQSYLARGNVDCNLDYSEESLENLWIWYRNYRCYIRRPDAEMEQAKNYYPEEMTAYIPKYKLTETSSAIGMDIGIYFGETFIHNHNELKWDYIKKPKTSAYYHQPAVIGFIKNIALSPWVIVTNCVAAEEERGEDKNLVKMYKLWENRI